MDRFVADPLPDMQLWRYVDLAKLVSLSTSESLWFPRADKLSDTHEGSLTSPDVDARAARMQASLTAVPENVKQRINVDRLSRSWENVFSSGIRSAREAFAISCWHENPAESAAMWELYAARGQGIAIRTTLTGLKSSLSTPTTEPLIYSKVHYIDFSKEQIPTGNPVFPLLYKRQSFEHEREVRAIAPLVEMKNPAQYEHGIGIPVDLNTLIQDLYVHPGAPAWFFEVVESLRKRYAVDAPVNKSVMDSSPLY